MVVFSSSHDGYPAANEDLSGYKEARIALCFVVEV